MNFKEIFNCFYEGRERLKIIHVATADKKCKPNSASKLLVTVELPNLLYYLDYRFTQSFNNIHENPQVSVSFMDDAGFTGYRLTGTVELAKGKEYEQVGDIWKKKVIAYETERMIARIRGSYSTQESEKKIPADFVIVKFTAKEASVIKPDRVLRAEHGEE